MATNLNEEQKRIQGMSDNQISEGLQSEPGTAPFTQFLGAIELTRRGRQRKAAGAAIAANKMAGRNVKERLISEAQTIEPRQDDGIARFSDGGMVGDIQKDKTVGFFELWNEVHGPKSVGLDIAKKYFNPSHNVDPGKYPMQKKLADGTTIESNIKARREGAPKVERDARAVNFAEGGLVRRGDREPVAYNNGGGVRDTEITEVERKLEELENLAQWRRTQSSPSELDRFDRGSIGRSLGLEDEMEAQSTRSELRRFDRTARRPRDIDSRVPIHAPAENFAAELPTIENRNPSPLSLSSSRDPDRRKTVFTDRLPIQGLIEYGNADRKSIGKGLKASSERQDVIESEKYDMEKGRLSLADPRFDVNPPVGQVEDADKGDVAAATIDTFANEGETPAQRTQRIAEATALLRMAASFTSNPNIADAFTQGALGAAETMGQADADVTKLRQIDRKLNQELRIENAKLDVKISDIISRSKSGLARSDSDIRQLAAELTEEAFGPETIAGGELSKKSPEEQAAAKDQVFQQIMMRIMTGVSETRPEETPQEKMSRVTKQRVEE